jgi:hypothetical protein
MEVCGLSLVGLVEAARQRVLARDHIERWHREVRNWDRDAADYAKWAARDVADEVCRLCLGGQFGTAAAEARAWRDEDMLLMHECPAWIAFHEAVSLAERIDCFLAVLENDRLAAPLARDCRGNLELLGVLGDWCQDGNRPLAAAEARHLLALARSHSQA